MPEPDPVESSAEEPAEFAAEPTQSPAEVTAEFASEVAQSPAEASTEYPAELAQNPAEVTTELAAQQAEQEAAPAPGRVHRARLAFRGWRRGRPFWGGLLVLLGAGEILITYQAPFGIIVHFGLYGLAGYLVPIMLAVLGILIVFDPVHRTFYSVLSVLAALGTWLTSNLGGFFVGMLLGLIGGSLAFGWQYGERPERPARAQRGRRHRLRPRTRAAE